MVVRESTAQQPKRVPEKASLLISSYVIDELSFDKFQIDKNVKKFADQAKSRIV